MISAIFIDRPRLAMVIAFVITIAGALALTQIPVAQFPDIVPLQVMVNATFPGASAEVVEASVAQPLEAQVIGVDRALCMKSNTHFVILAQAVLFRGAGLAVVWPQLAALLVIGAILFFFSLRRFRSFLR